MLGVSGHRGAAPISLLCVAPFMVVLDANLITIALPSIRDELGFSRSELQWVIGASSLAFGGALLIAGRAGDLYGRRRLLVAGLALFSAASLAGAVAPSQWLLLGARAIQGLGAAMAFPASLALIASTFPAGGDRDRALGVYGAVVSGAFLSGMVLGGLLTASLGWRSVLLVNAPIGLWAALAAHRLAGETRSPVPPVGLDLPGALAASAAVLALLWALARSLPLLVVVAGLLAAIACEIERRAPAPLVPRALLGRRTMAGALIAALFTVGTGVGVMFVLTLYLQDVLGYEPAAAGLALTLLGVGGVAAGLGVPRVAERIGLVRALAASLIVQALGVALLIPIGANGPIQLVLAGTTVIGIGHFGATVTFTALATAGICDEEHGIAMGAVSSAQQIGGAVGLALLVAVAGAHTGVVEGFRSALALGAGLSALAAGLVLAISGDARAEQARRPRREWRTRRLRGRSSRP